MTSDPYSRPAESGLKILAEVQDESVDYVSKRLVLWQHLTTGELFWGSDSSCTCCQLPFEDVHVADLIKLTPGNRNCLELAANGFIGCGEVQPGLIGQIDAMLNLASEILNR